MLKQIVAADSLGCQFSKQYSNVRLRLWTFFKAVAELHVRIRIGKPGEQIDGISFVVETVDVGAGTVLIEEGIAVKMPGQPADTGFQHGKHAIQRCHRPCDPGYCRQMAAC